ncbi:MAG: DUF554 domain-containing protein [Prevotellaceae bacterium]|jgi:uncharacterized membrane protein YqgA involved in biofilm formation|nr:DUF554 domain-containing protein [Prevotellaceae bacterium]
MTGTLINALAIIAGSSIGMLCGTKISEKYKTIFFQAIGLFTLLLGIKMALDMSSPLLIVISLVLGGFLGMKLQLSAKTEQLGDYLKAKFKSANNRFTEGLITSFLLFCMGSMAIVGAMEEGLGHSSDLLLTKSVMDFFSSLILATTLGVSVLLAFIPLLLFQGGITLIVSLAGENIPQEMISGLTTIGGILLIGLGLTLLQIKKIDIINMLPSLLFICLAVWLQGIWYLVVGI